jgi:hypothetical protein
MKDKFQYTAIGVIHYSCPCCAAKWMTNKLEYCPNCEVKLQYTEPHSLPTEEEIRKKANIYTLDFLNDHLLSEDETDTVSDEDIILRFEDEYNFIMDGYIAGVKAITNLLKGE